MIRYLTAEQVLFIHARLIAETGGEHGLLDLGLLQSAVARPQATFDRQDLYPNIYAKAAAFLQSLIGNHPFVDGNKRTAIASAGIFLLITGYRLKADNQELETFTFKCAQGLVTVDQIKFWLETNTMPIS